MIKHFLKDSLLYTLTGVLTKGIGFVMLPIYLMFLTKEQYGQFDYTMSIGRFLTIIVTLEISQSVIRFVPEHQNNLSLQKQIITSGIQLTVFGFFLLLCLSQIFSDFLSIQLFGELNHSIGLIVACYAIMALLYLSTVIFRAQLNSKAATKSSAASALITALATLGLLKFNGSCASSLIGGIVIGQGSVLLYNFYRLKEYYDFRIYPSVIKDMLSFSSPLVFSSLGVVFMMFIDRIMIKEMLDFSDLALYAVAVKFASILSIIVVGFQSALAPLTYSNIDNKHLKTNLRKFFFSYIIASASIVFLLFLVSEFAIELIIGSQYTLSGKMIPIMALSIMFQSGYIFFPGLSITKKTKILALINILVGIVNLVLNFSFIDSLGVIGAVYATLFSSMLFFLLNFYFSEQCFPLFLEQKT